MYSQLFITLSSSLAAIAGQYTYNNINFFQFNSRQHLLQKFFDSNGYATVNLVVGIAFEDCEQDLEIPGFRGMQRYLGGNVLTIVTLHPSQFPMPPSGCSELFFIRYGSRLSEPSHRLSTITHSSVADWAKETIGRTSFNIINSFDHIVHLWWEDERKLPVLQGSIKAHGHWNITSFIGHLFVARRTDNGEEPSATDDVVDFFVVNELEYELHPRNRLEVRSLNDSLLVLVFVQFIKLNFLAYCIVCCCFLIV